MSPIGGSLPINEYVKPLDSLDVDEPHQGSALASSLIAGLMGGSD